MKNEIYQIEKVRFALPFHTKVVLGSITTGHKKTLKLKGIKLIRTLKEREWTHCNYNDMGGGIHKFIYDLDFDPKERNIEELTKVLDYTAHEYHLKYLEADDIGNMIGFWVAQQMDSHDEMNTLLGGFEHGVDVAKAKRGYKTDLH